MLNIPSPQVLLLWRILLTNKLALVALPFISLCAEKVAHLERLLDPIGRTVKAFYGMKV